MNNRTVHCLYCSKVCSAPTGEHIIAQSIGGTKKIRPVCDICNNQILSKIDNQLSSYSPLAMVMAKEFESKPMQFQWGVDPNFDNVMIEGQFSHENRSFRTYPQLIFGKKPHMRCAHEELDTITFNDFQNIFFNKLLLAYKMHRSGKKRILFFDEVPLKYLENKGRYPPRVFCKESPLELAKKREPRFTIRYASEADKKEAMHLISEWRARKRFSTYDKREISGKIGFIVMYDPRMAARAIMKTSVNILVHLSNYAIIPHLHCKPSVDYILGEVELTNKQMEENGPIKPSVLSSLNTPEGHHKILVNSHHSFGAKYWNVWISLFGGQFCMKSKVWGETSESWIAKEVLIPIKSNKWVINDSEILSAFEANTEWKDFSASTPTIDMSNVELARIERDGRVVNQ